LFWRVSRERGLWQISAVSTKSVRPCFEGGKRALSNGVSGENAYKAEIEKLQKIIGKQAIQIEILKKTEELFTTR